LGGHFLAFSVDFLNINIRLTQYQNAQAAIIFYYSFSWQRRFQRLHGSAGAKRHTQAGEVAAVGG
jgi:hypothetical protein